MTFGKAIAAVAAIVVVLTLGGAVQAQAPAAANSQIQAVYDDLDRFEAQAQGASIEEARTIAVNTLVVMEIFYLFSVGYLKNP